MLNRTLDVYGRDVYTDSDGRRYVVQSDGASYITDCCDGAVTCDEDGMTICKICFGDVHPILGGSVRGYVAS